MENLEIVNLTVVKADLAHRVQRITNYADAASGQPSPKKVFHAEADAELYANLWNNARLRAFKQLGRLCNRVEQPPETDDAWKVAVKLVPDAMNPQLVEQIGNALTQMLAADIAAHWLLLLDSDRAAAIVHTWQMAQDELRSLCLWKTNPTRIKPHEF